MTIKQSAFRKIKHTRADVTKTYLSARVTVMVRIKIVLGHLFGVLSANGTLTHLLANTRVQLTHLRPLAHLVAIFVKILCGFDSPPSRGSPHIQWFQPAILSTLIKHFLPFRLPVSQQDVGHLLRVIFALFRQRRVGLVSHIMRNTCLDVSNIRQSKASLPARRRAHS